MKAELPRAAALIGVDGGASEVKAREIVFARAAGRDQLRAGEHGARVRHASFAGFRPLALAEQELERDMPALGAEEREAGRQWIETIARAVLQVARAIQASQALVGFAMPGLKTADGRGIAIARNGPRIPSLADELEHCLASGGLALVAPIAALASDGECRGIGEELAEDGLFRGIASAYYVGGGTGVAEALKLRGALVSLDTLADRFPKAWQLRDASGRSYDELLSAAGVNAAYAQAISHAVPLEPGSFPEEQASVDPRARAVLADAGRALGEFLHARLVMLRNLEEPIVLERIVLGQRLGAWFEDARTGFAAECERSLAAALAGAADRELRAAYLADDGASARVRPSLITVSRFDGAAALGAVALALRDLAEAGS